MKKGSRKIDPMLAFGEWKQDKGELTLQEAMDLFEDGQTVDAQTAGAIFVLSELITQLPPSTRLREITT